MSEYTIRPKTFYANVTASSNGTWQPVDYKFTGIQQRSVMGSMNASDTIVIEIRNADPISLLNVVTTATAYTGAASFSGVITGPFTDIRVRKIGETGAATVIGLV